MWDTWGPPRDLALVEGEPAGGRQCGCGGRQRTHADVQVWKRDGTSVELHPQGSDWPGSHHVRGTMICFPGFLLIPENPPCPLQGSVPMCAAPIFKRSSVDETASGDLGQTPLARRKQPDLGRWPQVVCHLQVLQKVGAARTIGSLGQGGGVYVLPGYAAIADNAGLAPRILLILCLFLPLADLNGPKGQATQLVAQPPSSWILKSLPL